MARSFFPATTRTPHGGIKTWYLHETYGDTWRDMLAILRQHVQGETLDLYRPAWRDVRLAILRQHAQEETLDRILRWVATGALSYSPQTADGDRLENYINSATKVVNRAIYRGVDCGALRDALDAATFTQRQAIEIRRRERLDGMRRQVREKADDSSPNVRPGGLRSTSLGGWCTWGTKFSAGSFTARWRERCTRRRCRTASIASHRGSRMKTCEVGLRNCTNKSRTLLGG